MGAPMADTPLVKHISECFIKLKYPVEDAKNPVYLCPTELRDLSIHYVQFGLLFDRSREDPIDILLDNLKHSLSVALVHFYPLAGQFETQVDEDEHTSFIFIDCNKGPGAKFIHASLNADVSDLVDPRKDIPDVVNSLFDLVGAISHDGNANPLLSIQVTEIVDGVFIGCSMNHVCGDGTSFWHFFNTWSEIFMAENGSNIRTSRPPIYKKWFLDGTGPIIKLPFTNPNDFISRYEAPTLRHRFFRFSPESISNLKAKANAECESRSEIVISSLQSLIALVWRSITRARSLSDESETKCKFHVNYRRRLKPALSDDYFGNLLTSIQVRSNACELLRRDLGWAAMLAHRAVAEHDDGKVREIVEAWMQSPSVSRPGLFFDSNNIVIGSSPRFEMYGSEFGMGKAVAVLSGIGNKFDGKVTCYPGRDGGGSVDLEISLRPDSMCKLESGEEFMEFVRGEC